MIAARGAWQSPDGGLPPVPVVPPVPAVPPLPLPLLPPLPAAPALPEEPALPAEPEAPPGDALSPSLEEQPDEVTSTQAARLTTVQTMPGRAPDVDLESERFMWLPLAVGVEQWARHAASRSRPPLRLTPRVKNQSRSETRQAGRSSCPAGAWKSSAARRAEAPAAARRSGRSSGGTAAAICALSVVARRIAISRT